MGPSGARRSALRCAPGSMWMPSRTAARHAACMRNRRAGDTSSSVPTRALRAWRTGPSARMIRFRCASRRSSSTPARPATARRRGRPSLWANPPSPGEIAAPVGTSEKRVSRTWPCVTPLACASVAPPGSPPSRFDITSYVNFPPGSGGHDRARSPDVGPPLPSAPGGGSPLAPPEAARA